MSIRGKLLKYQIKATIREVERGGATKDNQTEPQFHVNLQVWFNRVAEVS